MFERYIIVPDSLRSVAGGFAFDVRLAYYRGIGLSMIEGFEIELDKQACAPEAITFGLNGERFSFAELEAEPEMRWEFNQAATLLVRRDGGLPPGPHEIAVTEIIRVSYMPEPARRTDRKTLVLAAGGSAQP